MEKVLRFIIIMALSGFIFACASYHYSLFRERGSDKPVITAANVPMEKIPKDFAGTGTLNIKGVQYAIRKELDGAPVYAAKERIRKLNKAEGCRLVDAKGDKVPSFMVKEKYFDFICFVTPGNHVRGYVFDATPSGTAITSLEADLKEISTKGSYGRIPESDVPAEYLRIMPSPPDFSIRGGSEDSSDIYSCFPSGDGNTEMSEIKRRLSLNNWQTENWDDILEIADAEKGGKEKGGGLVVAKKDDMLCHIMMNKEAGKLLVSYRFSKTRSPRVAY